MTTPNGKKRKGGALIILLVTAVLLAVAAESAWARRGSPPRCDHPPQSRTTSYVEYCKKGPSAVCTPGIPVISYVATLDGCNGRKMELKLEYEQAWWKIKAGINAKIGGRIWKIVKAELSLNVQGEHTSPRKKLYQLFKSADCFKYNVNRREQEKLWEYYILVYVEGRVWCGKCGTLIATSPPLQLGSVFISKTDHHDLLEATESVACSSP